LIRTFPALRRLFGLKYSDDVSRARLMDEITEAHAHWVRLNGQLPSLSGDVRIAAEKALDHASNRYKLLVSRLMERGSDDAA
jgi:hypothetical protein